MPMHTLLLDQLEEASRDHSQHPLLIQGAVTRFEKLSSEYDKTSHLVMSSFFVYPRCNMKYFIDNGWDSGSENFYAHIGTNENLTTRREGIVWGLLYPTIIYIFFFHCTREKGAKFKVGKLTKRYRIRRVERKPGYGRHNSIPSVKI